MKAALTHAECPVCKNQTSKSTYKDPVYYFQCSNCNTMFIAPPLSVDVMKAYADAQYKDGAYTEYVKAKALKVHTFEDRLKAIEQWTTGRKIKHLDVGCSAGFMIEVGLKAGFDSYGVEFSKEAISYAQPEIQKRISNTDVNALKLDENEKFDLITCFDIIEHVQQPVQFLSTLRGLLKPGGLLVLTTPDTEHYLASVMGKSWPMLQPYQHTILFSKKSLNQTLGQAGFEELKSTAAFKVLTFSYLTGQLSILNPVISKVMAATNKLIPATISNKPLKLNISEFMSVSRANN